MEIQTIESNPVPCEGVQWDGSREHGEAIIAWMTGSLQNSVHFSVVGTYISSGMQYQINLGGVERAMPLDWIVNNNGIFSRYSEEDFPKLFHHIETRRPNELDIRDSVYHDGPMMFDPEVGINILNADGTSLLTITPKGQIVGNIYNAGDAGEIFAEALRTSLRKHGRLDGAKVTGRNNEVITYEGSTYFKTCDEFVDTRPGGSQTFCVKPVNHPSKEHEDVEGVKRRV